MATIREITGEYKQLLEMAEESDMDPKTIRDTIESVEGEFEDKADGCAKVDASLGDKVDAIDKEMKRLAGMKSVINNNRKRIKKNLEEAMRETGKTKFKTALYSFGIQKNPAALHILNESKIPKNYYIPQPDTLDKKSLKAYIKEHGDTDFAELKQGESLRIR